MSICVSGGLTNGWDCQLRWLRPAVRSWIQINGRYAKWWGGNDALYWYNERAAVGSFAAGAARADYHVLEEYNSMKRDSETAKRSGRTDLYVGKGSRHATLEAKLCWMAPDSSGETLLRVLDHARDDARKNALNTVRIGAVFYVVKAPKGDTTDASLTNRIERIREIGPDGLAWCFPRKTRKLKSEKTHLGQYVWPGVILALKVARGSPNSTS